MGLTGFLMMTSITFHSGNLRCLSVGGGVPAKDGKPVGKRRRSMGSCRGHYLSLQDEYCTIGKKDGSKGEKISIRKDRARDRTYTRRTL